MLFIKTITVIKENKLPRRTKTGEYEYLVLQIAIIQISSDFADYMNFYLHTVLSTEMGYRWTKWVRI